jgi:hypothetical protein
LLSPAGLALERQRPRLSGAFTGRTNKGERSDCLASLSLSSLAAYHTTDRLVKTLAKTFSEEETQRILYQLALEAGNATKASEALKDQGIEIASSTLSAWKASDKHRERYARISVEVEDRVSRAIAEDVLEQGIERVSILRRIAQETNEALDNGDMDAVHRLAGADRNFATSGGILFQNSRMLTDKPTQVVEQRLDVQQIDRALARLGLLETVEGTAVELLETTEGASEETPS